MSSSVLARVPDTLIFETVAFLGVLSMGEFALQVLMAFALGMLLEIILFPAEYLIMRLTKRIITEKSS